MFVFKKDAAKELWSGKRLGEVEAQKKFLIDEVYTFDTLEEIYEKNASKKEVVYFDFKLTYLKFKALKRFTKGINTHKNIAQNIEKMRLIKSDAEIEIIKQALNITKQAHHKAMKVKKISKNEFELQATIENIFKKEGAYSDAYTSIGAGGNNANTLHYIENNKAFVDGELILIDAGCEYEYYASDITRTIPVNGTFSKAQKELYNMVLNVQLQIIEMIKPNILRSNLQKKK